MYRVEYGFAENFTEVDEWQTLEGFEKIEAENAEEAAKEAACTDGLEDALFRVFELTKNEFGGYDPADAHNPDYFVF